MGARAILVSGFICIASYSVLLWCQQHNATFSLGMLFSNTNEIGAAGLGNNYMTGPAGGAISSVRRGAL